MIEMRLRSLDPELPFCLSDCLTVRAFGQISLYAYMNLDQRGSVICVIHLAKLHVLHTIVDT